MTPFQKRFPALTWSASGTSSLPLDNLPSVLLGGIAHLLGVLLKVTVSITAAAGNDTPAAEFCRAIELLTIRDRASNVVCRLRGHLIRTLVWAATGKKFVDAAVVTAGSGAQVRTFYLRIPFTGLRGLAEAKDALLPCDRFAGGSIEITWGTATPYSFGTVTACTVTPCLDMTALPEIRQGADIKYLMSEEAAAQQVNYSFQGLKQLCAIIANPDLDHSDYTSISTPNQYLQEAVPLDRAQLFNDMCAEDTTSRLTAAAPEFVPVVFMPRGGKLSECVGFGRGRTTMDVTTSHATTQVLAWLEIGDAHALVRSLVSGAPSGSVYDRVKNQVPSYSKKNGGHTAPKKSVMLDATLPRKLTV